MYSTKKDSQKSSEKDKVKSKRPKSFRKKNVKKEESVEDDDLEEDLSSFRSDSSKESYIKIKFGKSRGQPPIFVDLSQDKADEEEET